MSSLIGCAAIKWQSQQLMIKPQSLVDAPPVGTTKYEFEQDDGATIATDRYHLVKGVQTASYDTNFEQTLVSQLCQSEAYEILEGIPTVDLNITKNLDGWAPVYCMATADATTPSLFGRANVCATVGIGIYDCSVDFTAEDDTVDAIAVFPEVQTSSFSFTFNADGSPFTEDVSFVGNNVIWWNRETSEDPAAWAAATVYDEGEAVLEGGNIYVAVNDGVTSAAPAPTHTSGTVADGGGVLWKYAGIALNDDGNGAFTNACDDTTTTCDNPVTSFLADYASIKMGGACIQGDACTSPKKKVATTEDLVFLPSNGPAVVTAFNTDTFTANAKDSNGQYKDHFITVLPPEILKTGLPDGSSAEQKAVVCAGINGELNDQGAGTATDFENSPLLCINSMTVSTDLNREDINCLGIKGPRTRTITPPISVTTAIEVVSKRGAQISALQLGVFNKCDQAGNQLACSTGKNLNDQTIRIVTCEGLYLYMGTKNKLQSVSTTGGSTDGDNLTVTYTYQTFNTLTVIHEDEGRINQDNAVNGVSGNPWLTETVTPTNMIDGVWTPVASFLVQDPAPVATP